ncbi:tRNA-His guanylyltransferase [Elasticomyces elasticus]|uniref:tRNA(His) guanylyltransferase n=1 Tax=Exophiala sideris TaxID=1016849 RepID=A0ABR0JLE4_9EURO|nr:tRNA-His guanylyltransferase [Elasticomyces elasticus]KAK5035152.1 tRNA-His guanylyltransferase [Exophiala sideris]KAK5039496.1 tRNA-His guanylyltransferase [Exophiala sideris]KAK5066076.1 tRNA-His guanylyltransferase [Exophiala sideris]KAK5186753.1 tRNA-His guanylyltransferase [Eurotiomycetes sp. CCFEE 6388]
MEGVFIKNRLSNHYAFTKPNDIRALDLMNKAATHVVTTIPEIVVGYGVSDEYSFVFHRSTTLFERRAAKLVSTVVSTFTAAYVAMWPTCFTSASDGGYEDEGEGKAKGGLDIIMLPTFDGRAVCYPSWENLRDYLSWRQVDCHINNLYNTTFWALVNQGGMSHTEAEEYLKGTVSADKNEILWSRFGINYNNEAEVFRKGSVVFREYALESVKDDRDEKIEGDGASGTREQQLSKTQMEKMRKTRQKAKVVVRHVDIIRDEFWVQRPWIWSGKPGRLIDEGSES